MVTQFLSVMLLMQTGLVIGLPGIAAPSPVVEERQALPTPSVVAPNGSCGPRSNGNYFCPDYRPCCNKNGYCGYDERFCLTVAPVNCDPVYAFPGSNACYAPKDKVTLTPDGTCGKKGVGIHGYRCQPSENFKCCSAYGYCGNSAAHCTVGPDGCQTEYGVCNP